MDRMEREREREWLFTARTIVKYIPEYYDENGRYLKEEWQGMYDIGETYDGHLLTLGEYLDIEQRYVDAVLELMRTTNCQYLAVFFMGDTPRSRKSSLKKMASKKNRFLVYDQPLYKTYVNLRQGQRIHISKIDQVVRLNLREYTYTALVNWENHLEIHFDDYYYMYCNSRIDIDTLREKISNIGLYVL